MPNGVVNDVADVGVGELISDLGTPAGGGNEAGVSKHLEVLGQQRLTDLSPRGAERGLYFVDAAGPAGELDDRRQANRRGQSLEQVGGSGQNVRRWRWR
jgi:hypothetical protein